MMKLEIIPTVSLGNVITALSMFGAAAAVYAAVVSKDVQHDERIAVNATEIVRVENKATLASEELKQELKEVNKNLAMLNQNMVRLMLSDPKLRERETSNVFSKPSTR